MNRRLQTLFVGVVVLAVLLAAAFTLRIQFVALVPGPTINTIGEYEGDPVISVDGKTPNQRAGHLNLTTIGVVSQITILQAVEGWFDDGVSVVPTELVYPPNVSKAETDKKNKDDYDNSENAAVSAALGHLGYPTKVVVRDPGKESPVQQGDALSTVDGQAVASFKDLEKVLSTIAVGTDVPVEYLHFGAPASTTVVTSAPAEGKSGSRLGYIVAQRPYAPFNVTFAQNDIGGPSAGLMLTLGIIDLVGPSSITGGKFIAGTGTIDAEGKVGPIGGIRLKMKAAREAGAGVFLVPADNCGEALDNPPDGLTMVKVTGLEDAVTSLKSYLAGQDTPTCSK